MLILIYLENIEDPQKTIQKTDQVRYICLSFLKKYSIFDWL